MTKVQETILRACLEAVHKMGADRVKQMSWFGQWKNSTQTELKKAA